MSKKYIILMILLLQSCMMITASGQASFSNEVLIGNEDIEFIIRESYSGTEAKELRSALDMDGDGIVNSTELDIFINSFEENRILQYQEYIIVNDNEISLLIDSFDISFDSVEGAVNSESVCATISIVYRMTPHLTNGTYNIWILGHPSIESMHITLPERSVLLTYDGMDNVLMGSDNSRVFLEGSSDVRSFILDGNQTFEYAVSMDIKLSNIIADLSMFNYFFSGKSHI